MRYKSITVCTSGFCAKERYISTVEKMRTSRLTFLDDIMLFFYVTIVSNKVKIFLKIEEMINMEHSLEIHANMITRKCKLT